MESYGQCNSERVGLFTHSLPDVLDQDLWHLGRPVPFDRES